MTSTNRKTTRRTVSSFFVGWVFIVSLIYLAKSPAVRFLRRRLSAAVDLLFPKPAKSLEQVEGNDGEEHKLRNWLVETLLGDDDVNADPLNFVFVLTVFAAVGSLSMYGSLLTFRPPGTGDDALCGEYFSNTGLPATSDGNSSICNRMGRHVSTVYAHCWPHKTQLGPQSFVRPAMGNLPHVGRLVRVIK